MKKIWMSKPSVAYCNKADSQQPCVGVGIEALEGRQLLSAAHPALLQNTSHDRRFINLDANGSIVEILLGNMAQTQASSDVVKAFGQRMITDHTQLSAQLTTIANNLGVTAPTTLNAAGARTVRLFSRLSGAAFDSAFASYAVKDHSEDVTGLNLYESTNGGAAALRDFETNTELPLLVQHLTLAQQMDQTINGTSGMGTTGTGRTGTGTTGTGSTGTTTGTSSTTGSTTGTGSTAARFGMVRI